MPITECRVHGEASCIEMCEHLVAELDEGRYSRPSVLPIYRIRMCAACAEEHERVFQVRLPEPEVNAALGAIYDVLNEKSRLKCEGCIDQIRVDHARRTQQTLAVPVFEHTLMHSESPQIDALRALLLDRMDPRGNHGTCFYGCRISAGSVLRPLTIRIYGCTRPSEQLATLEVIEQFFVDEPAYQRCVQFYEPIRSTVDADGMRTRLKDVLLREVVER